MGYRQIHPASPQIRTDRSALAQGRLCRLPDLFNAGRPGHGMARAAGGDENALPRRDSIDDGDAAVDTGQMKTTISWVRMSISLAAIASAVFFFWRASLVGLSNEKIIYTVLAVFCGVLALLA